MAFIWAFFNLFFWSLYLLAPLIVFLAVVIVVLGQIVSRLEGWNKFDGLYWSFITATTVGYGDIRPMRKIAKVLSVLIALVGMVFTGIVIAVALSTASITIEKHADEAIMIHMKENF